LPTSTIAPCYVTLPGGQIRLWRTGSGPDLVGLAGLTLAASVSARRLAEALPDRRITVIELPGIGGSAEHEAGDLGSIASALDQTLEACGIEAFSLAAFDLAGAMATTLCATSRRTVDRTLLFGADAASAWAARGLAPPDIRPRQDGTHLTSLFAFIRDCHLLKPDDPTQPATSGDPLPDPDELDATVTAAARRPERYAALWAACAQAIGPAPGERVSLAEARNALAGSGLRPGSSALPRTVPRPDSGLWHHYVETARGRMHLRRAGGLSGRPTLVIPTGGGSSAQFAPVVTGLAQGGGRQTFAVDYLGNGLSDKPVRDVTIGTLADDMAALLDALGFDEVDVWGSHTGALVGLELAVRHPERVRRAVLEGPVFISPDFQSDILSHYFPPIRPDKWGLHIQAIWNWRRDMFMYWPWYKVARETARQLGVPSAVELHRYAIGILESGPTYDLAYRSAFTYDTAARLPLLRRPALVCAGPNDMLVSGLKDAERLAVPGVEVRLTPTTVWWPDPDPKLAAETLALYRVYLDAA
jgi:pimeloyl-ACP methyl ester carboxylesterase